VRDASTGGTGQLAPGPPRVPASYVPYVPCTVTLQVCYKPFAAVTCGKGPVPVATSSVTRAMAVVSADTAEAAAAAAAAPVVCKVCKHAACADCDKMLTLTWP
jgi:hypothetical protein